jgi:hypothetical protein
VQRNTRFVAGGKRAADGPWQTASRPIVSGREGWTGRAANGTNVMIAGVCAMSFLIRWLVAFVLLAVTWNPTEWNYVRWARENWELQLPLTVLGGLILLVVYIVYLRATLRSIGPIGMGLVIAVFAALVWVLIDYGWLQPGNAMVNQWLAILLASLVLGIGLSWSILRRRISGQVDIDDVDEE